MAHSHCSGPPPDPGKANVCMKEWSSGRLGEGASGKAQLQASPRPPGDAGSLALSDPIGHQFRCLGQRRELHTVYGLHSASSSFSELVEEGSSSFAFSFLLYSGHIL